MSKQDQDVKNLIERDLGVLSESTNYLSFQFSRVSKYIGKRVMELGAGIGNHTERIIVMQPELVVALEKEPSFCKELENKFGGKIKTICTALEDIDHFSNELKGYKLDTIMIFNVLEHIEHDVACLDKLNGIMADGGRLLIIVPAFPFLFSELDLKYGHYRRYTKKMLRNYADKLQMDVVKSSYFNIISWFSWLIFAKIGKRKNIHKSSMRLFDRMLPFIQRIEEKIPIVPFGLSLYGVLQKNEAKRT